VGDADPYMSKVVATIYAAGVVGASMLAFGAAAALVRGPHPSLWQPDWFIVVAFSGVPLGALLFAAARKEWLQREVSALALFFVIAAVSLMVLVGILAHVEGLDALVSAFEILVCVAGYILLTRSKQEAAV